MSKKKADIGFFCSQLDAGQSAGCWEKWRPTLSLLQHDDTLIDRLELSTRRDTPRSQTGLSRTLPR